MKRFLIFIYIFSLLFSVFAENSDVSESRKEVSDQKKSISDDDIIVNSEFYNSGTLEREVIYFENRVKNFRDEIKLLVAREISEKKFIVEEKFSKAIRKQELAEIQNRNEAIILYQNSGDNGCQILEKISSSRCQIFR